MERPSPADELDEYQADELGYQLIFEIEHDNQDP